MKNVHGLEAKIGDTIGYIHSVFTKDGTFLVRKTIKWHDSNLLPTAEIACNASCDPLSDKSGYMRISQTTGNRSVPEGEINWLSAKATPWIYGEGQKNIQLALAGINK